MIVSMAFERVLFSDRAQESSRSTADWFKLIPILITMFSFPLSVFLSAGLSRLSAARCQCLLQPLSHLSRATQVHTFSG